jgi:hypothetical protein
VAEAEKRDPHKRVAHKLRRVPSRQPKQDYDGPERRAGDETGSWRADITQRMEAYEENQVLMAQAIDSNTELTEQIKKNTDDIVHAFKALKGTITVAGWVVTLAKALTAIAIAIGAGYWFFKTGEPPKK